MTLLRPEFLKAEPPDWIPHDEEHVRLDAVHSKLLKDAKLVTATYNGLNHEHYDLGRRIRVGRRLVVAEDVFKKLSEYDKYLRDLVDVHLARLERGSVEEKNSSLEVVGRVQLLLNQVDPLLKKLKVMHSNNRLWTGVWSRLGGYAHIIGGKVKHDPAGNLVVPAGKTADPLQSTSLRLARTDSMIRYGLILVPRGKHPVLLEEAVTKRLAAGAYLKGLEKELKLLDALQAQARLSSQGQPTRKYLKKTMDYLQGEFNDTSKRVGELRNLEQILRRAVEKHEGKTKFRVVK